MGGGLGSTNQTPTKRTYGRQTEQDGHRTADGTGRTPYSSTSTRINYGVWNCVFSQSSSSDRLTDEQREDLIAENIYDWWQSGKSYKKWYADKFLQLKFEFEE